MSGAAARRRASIAISFGLQAAMIAALLGLPALESAHHSPAVRAVPRPSTQIPATLIPVTQAPGTAVYPMRLALLMHIDGGQHAIGLPTGWAVPPQPVYVPAGRAATVTVAVTNPGPGTARNVWFAIAPASVMDNQVTQLGISLGSTFWVQVRTSQLSPGGYMFSRFTVPAADLQPGRFPVIVMGAQEGSHQVTYGLVQLDPSGHAG